MGFGNFLEYIGEQSALSGMQNWAKEQFGQSNPMLASLAENDPRAFREMLPKLLERKMAQDAVSQAMGQSPLTQVSGIEGSAPITVGGQPQQTSALERVYAQLNPAEYAKWATEEKPKRAMELEAKEREKQGAINTLTNAYQNVNAEYENLIGNPDKKIEGKIAESYRQVNPSTAGRAATIGGLGAVGRFIMGTDYTNLASDLTVIKANQFLDSLQKLKDASPKGASGLGSLTETEGEKIQSKIESLNQEQDPEKLKKSLENLNNYLKESKKRIDSAYKADLEKFGVSPQFTQPTSSLGQLTKPTITPEMARAELARRKGGQ